MLDRTVPGLKKIVASTLGLSRRAASVMADSKVDSSSGAFYRWTRLPSVHPPRHDHGITSDCHGLLLFGGNYGFGV